MFVTDFDAEHGDEDVADVIVTANLVVPDVDDIVNVPVISEMKMSEQL